MPRWTVGFDATITVSVEANDGAMAVKVAERTLNSLGIDDLRLSEVTQCSIGKIFVITNEESGVEIRK
ncbi:MAG: hypothetical protein ACYC0V_21710 [Armatimonadota bacterium]